MGRSLTGEERVVASELLLKFDDTTAEGALSTTMVNAFEYWLKAAAVNGGALDEASTNPASQASIGAFVRALIDLCRLKTDSVLITAHTDDDYSFCQAQVFAEDIGNIFVHHDISLPAFPLALAWMDIAPRPAAADGQGVLQ